MRPILQIPNKNKTSLYVANLIAERMDFITEEIDVSDFDNINTLIENKDAALLKKNLTGKYLPEGYNISKEYLEKVFVYLRIMNKASNVISVTGAIKPVSLGSMVLPQEN